MGKCESCGHETVFGMLCVTCSSVAARDIERQFVPGSPGELIEQIRAAIWDSYYGNGLTTAYAQEVDRKLDALQYIVSRRRRGE